MIFKMEEVLLKEDIIEKQPTLAAHSNAVGV